MLPRGAVALMPLTADLAVCMPTEKPPAPAPAGVAAPALPAPATPPLLLRLRLLVAPLVAEFADAALADGVMMPATLAATLPLTAPAPLRPLTEGEAAEAEAAAEAPPGNAFDSSRMMLFCCSCRVASCTAACWAASFRALLLLTSTHPGRTVPLGPLWGMSSGLTPVPARLPGVLLAVLLTRPLGVEGAPPIIPLLPPAADAAERGRAPTRRVGLPALLALSLFTLKREAEPGRADTPELVALLPGLPVPAESAIRACAA